MFNVTYEIISQESSEYGCAAEQGFIAENISLRDAIEYVTATRTSQCCGVTTIENNGNWITIYNGMEFLTGCHENRSIHFNRNVTPSSAARILKLIEG